MLPEERKAVFVGGGAPEIRRNGTGKAGHYGK
jgi:hypothetical protein